MQPGRILQILSLILLCHLAMPNDLSAQVTIENVTEKVTFESDKGFHIHTVMQGQTLYSIAKAYGVRMSSVTKENPKALYGIVAGTELKIPASEEAIAKARAAGVTEEPVVEEQPKEPETIKLEDTVLEIPAEDQPTTKSKEENSSAVVAIPMDASGPVINQKQEEQAEVEPIENLEEPVAEALVETPPAPEVEEEPAVSVIPREEPEPIVKDEEEDAPLVSVVPAEETKEAPKLEAVEEILTEPTPEEPTQTEEESGDLEVDDALKRLFSGVDDAIKLTDSLWVASETDSTLFKEKEETAPITGTPEFTSFDSESSAYVTDGFSVNLLDTAAVHDLLTKKYKEYYADTSSDDEFNLREYFFFYLDEKGRTLALQDERTEVNDNSNYFTDPELRELQKLDLGIQYEGNPYVSRAALGFEAVTERTVYNARIDKKRIRLFRTPLYVEYLDEEHPHFDLIMKEAQLVGRKGRCEIVVVSGTLSLSQKATKEYNPFAVHHSYLYERPFHSIQLMEFAR